MTGRGFTVYRIPAVQAALEHTHEGKTMNKTFAILSMLLALAAISPVIGGETSPKEAVIFDFEKDGNNRFEGAEKLQFVSEHATEGKTSGKIKLDQPLGIFFGFYGGTNMKGRWGEFDAFVVDVFVEGGPVKVGGYARDKESPSWDTRYNFEFTLQPGKRNLTFPLAGLNRAERKRDAGYHEARLLLDALCQRR